MGNDFKEIRGPNGSIPVERDALGYPRIRARDRNEAAFALGYMHANDRMAQTYLSLLAAQGRMMEFTGDRPFQRLIDFTVRRLNLGSDLDEQISQSSRETQANLRAYCQGWNLGVQKNSRPLVLWLLGIHHPHLQPASILLLYRFISYFGLSSLQERAKATILNLAVDHAPEPLLKILLGDGAGGLDAESLKKARLHPEGRIFGPPACAGSNALAVAKGRSVTNSALLLGELHLEIGRIPPVAYLCHLDLPKGRYLQGATIPGLPFLVSGRTNDVGWSFTYGRGDNCDILVERCKDGQYSAAGEQKPLQRRLEKVKVWGKFNPENWTFFDSEYGTLVSDANKPGDYPCYRWNASKGYGGKCLEAHLAIEQASDVEQAIGTLSNIKTVSLNCVVADKEGRIAHVHTGLVDSRSAGWTGAYPRKGWDLPERHPQTLPETARPKCLDPDQGLLISTNERITGPQGERWVSFPDADYRKKRFQQLLGQQEQIDLRALVNASYDEVDLSIEELLKVWGAWLPKEPESEELLRWSMSQSGGSGSVSYRKNQKLFYALYLEVIIALLENYIDPDKARMFAEKSELIFVFQVHLDRVLRLEAPELLGETALRELIETAWPLAKERARTGGFTSGPVRAPFLNMFVADRLPKWLGFDTAIVDFPGSPHSPFQCRTLRFGARRFRYGPGFHVVMDMGKPGLWYNICGGASERRFGPGYVKGIEDWLEGKFNPLGDAQGEPPDKKSSG